MNPIYITAGSRKTRLDRVASAIVDAAHHGTPADVPDADTVITVTTSSPCGITVGVSFRGVAVAQLQVFDGKVRGVLVSHGGVPTRTTFARIAAVNEALKGLNCPIRVWGSSKNNTKTIHIKHMWHPLSPEGVSINADWVGLPVGLVPRIHQR